MNNDIVNGKRPGPATRILSVFISSIMVASSALPVRAELPKVSYAPGAIYQGANLPVESLKGTRLDIHQFDNKAILEWESFNISANSHVEFHQPNASAIALNRVIGSSDASQIYGSIQANGRIYIINHNGVVFGENAVVNARELLASTLDIDNAVFNNTGIEFATDESGVLQAALRKDPANAAAMGEILIEKGAKISVSENGRVMMFAPSITNQGSITAEQGQIILAASQDEVFLAPAGDDDDVRGLVVGIKSGGDVNNVGELIAERGNISLLGLAVNQDGLARATTSTSINGSIVLQAQDGAAAPTVAGQQFLAHTNAGDLSLGEGSVTEVLPDASSDTATDAVAQKLSTIRLEGESVTLEENARVTATGGEVTILANATPADPAAFDNLSPPDPNSVVTIKSGAVIDVSGSDTTQVSVARNYIEVEIRGNELADAPLQQGNSLEGETLTVDIRRDSGFLNIDGALAAIERGVEERLAAGGTVTIEAVGMIDVDEGAVIDISGGQVVYQEDYVSPSLLVTASGDVHKIADANKNASYIGTLDSFFVEHDKWGVTESYRSLFGFSEQGYIQGYDSGKLELNSPGIEFDGEIRAQSIAGLHQVLAPENLGDDTSPLLRAYNQVPLGGQLLIKHLNSELQDIIIGEDDSIIDENGYQDPGVAPLVLSPGLFKDSGLSRVEINNAGRVIINRDLALQDFAKLDLKGTQVLLQSDITSSGGDVSLEATLNLFNQDLSTLLPVANAATTIVKVDGSIDVSGQWVNQLDSANQGARQETILNDGGNITLKSGNDVVLTENSLLDVSAGANLDTSGNFNGGSAGKITLSAANSDESLRTSAALSDLDIQGELRGFGFKKGGELAIQGELIQVYHAAAAAVSNDDADMMQAFTLQGGDVFSQEEDVSTGRNTIRIADNLFNRGGFESFQLQAVGAPGQNGEPLVVQSGATLALSSVSYSVNRALLEPSVEQSLLAGTAPVELIPSGTVLATFVDQIRLPESQQRSVDLSLSTGADEVLVLETGSVINGSIGSAISLTSGGSIYADGTISAPAGSVNMTLADGGSNSVNSRIHLGSNARLLAPGAVLIEPDAVLTGKVLDAGSVNLLANNGSIFAEQGAEINVDGVSQEIAILQDDVLVAQSVAGNAGQVSLTAAESLIYKGALSGNAALNREGGLLSVTMDPSNRDLTAPSATDVIEADEYYGEFVVAFDEFAGALPEFSTNIDDSLRGTGYVPVQQLESGGFDSLQVTVRPAGSSRPTTVDSLAAIEFAADLSLELDRQIILDAPIIRATGANTISLDAPYVALGSSFNDYRLDAAAPTLVDVAGTYQQYNPLTDPEISLDPTTGSGRLLVNANLAELVGELVTQGFTAAGGRLQADDSLAGVAGIELTATDLRLRGVRLNGANELTFEGQFKTASDVIIDAQRIYPSTITDFELTVTGADGSIEFADSYASVTAAPLSIGGSLTIAADHIVQNSDVYAPLGSLIFRADKQLQLGENSLTSSSGFGVEAPFFVTEAGGNIALPELDGEGTGSVVFIDDDLDAAAFERLLPEQFVLLDSDSVEVQQGARFDLRGGTDARAVEFVPGPGGSSDVLLADLDTGTGVDANESFAILPQQGEFAPYDPLLTPQSELIQGLAIGETLVLEQAVGDIPAGRYAILPARYALFGGYLVTPLDNTANPQTISNKPLADGSLLTLGHYGIAGSDIESGASRNFLIADSDIVRSRAEYLETPIASLYATESGLRTPDDAGSLTVEAQSNLLLAGQLVQPDAASAVPGRGTRVNIVSDVVNLIAGNQGVGVAVTAEQLAGLGADSLIIGGRASNTENGLELESVASQVNVDAGVVVEAAEIILIADAVSVNSASGQETRIQSTAEATGEQQRLIVAGDVAGGINGDAAVLAVSSRTLTLERAAPTGLDTGELTVTSNATILAKGSLVADVAGDMQLDGTLIATGALLNLGASQISLGETDGKGISSGLILSNAQLTAFDGASLRLRSDNAITVFGDTLNTQSNGELQFAELSLDAQEIVGVDNAGLQVSLTAERLALENSTGQTAVAAGVVNNGSALILAGDQIVLNDGPLKLQGYENVQLAANDYLLFSGEGELFTESDLTLTTPLITAAAGADYMVLAKDAELVVDGTVASTALPATAGLAAKVALQAANIDFGGNVRLQSGQFSLLQTGDELSPIAGDNIVIRDNAIINVAGITQTFGPVVEVTSGGGVQLFAETGDVIIGNGSVLDVSAGSVEGEAGVIDITATLGDTEIVSGAQLVASGTGGGFLLNTNTLNVAGVNDALAYTQLSQLLGSDYRAKRHIHLGNQGIEHAESLTVVAHDVRLSSDSDDVVIHGTIDASGQGMGTVRENGGTIVLASADSVEVESTAVLRATGTLDGTDPAVSAKGGTVEFYALDADADDAGGTTDRVNLKAGAVIDVRGGSNPVFTDELLITADRELGGEVRVHTRMIDAATGSFVQGELDATIVGAAKTDLIATNIDEVTSAIDAAAITAYFNETKLFMDNTASVVNGFRVTPGLHLWSAGDLTLAAEWDFFGPDSSGGWHFGETAIDDGVAGTLTLRAADDVILQASISDSIFLEPGNFFLKSKDVYRLDTSTESWSYNIVSGAQLSSADILAVKRGHGDLRLEADLDVRTATGDINIAAGNNIAFINTAAAVYTAGYNRGLSTHLEAILPSNPFSYALGAEYRAHEWLGGGANFPVDGGDVNVYAGGDVVSLAVLERPTDWQPRAGSAEAKTGVVLYNDSGAASGKEGALPTHWGIAYERFESGFAALGGGELRVNVQGDVSNVVFAVPTTGRTVDGALFDTINNVFLPSLETTEVAGGGIMDIVIGGNADNIQYYLGDGVADVVIAGNSGTVDGNSVTEIYTGFDADFRLVAGGEIYISELSDQGQVGQSVSQAGLYDPINQTVGFIATEYFTIEDGASTALHALSGDVLLGESGALTVTPDFKMVSHSADTNLTTDINQFPSHQGSILLLAEENINIASPTPNSGQPLSLFQWDISPDLFPSVQAANNALPSVEIQGAPIHADPLSPDHVPSVIVANNGSISPTGSNFWEVSLAESLYMEAGQDIRNLSIKVQNNFVDDITSFIAGRDIVQPTQRTTTGAFFSADEKDSDGVNQFEIAGPGKVEFIAGGRIDLGTSDGIETVGNTKNPFLPVGVVDPKSLPDPLPPSFDITQLQDDGADLIVMAGLGDEIDAAAFVQTYVVEGVDSIDADTGDVSRIDYSQQLDEYLDQRQIAVQQDAVSTFLSLSESEQRPLLTQVLFAEIKAGGTFAQTELGKDDFSRGFNAVDKLFPLNNPDGGVSLLLSQIQTLDGGDIEIVVPGGNINAGAASTSIIAKDADELGIFSAQAGKVNVMVDQDLLVNASRVFSLNGDLTVWSSEGDIDAGKGAKTVSSVALPIPDIGPTGEPILTIPPAVEGSGLQGVNVSLFAPQGVVNAGDAGIVALGDLTLGATAVLGADNIDVGGVSVGVPTASAGVGANVAGAGDATKSATEIADTVTDFGDEDEGSTTLGILSVNLVGFGDEPAQSSLSLPRSKSSSKGDRDEKRK